MFRNVFKLKSICENYFLLLLSYIVSICINFFNLKIEFTVLAKLRNGIKLYLRFGWCLGDYRAHDLGDVIEVYYDRVYLPKRVMKMLDSTNQENLTILDFGSATGDFAILMAYLYSSSVRTYEVDQTTYRILQKNISINNLPNQSKIYPYEQFVTGRDDQSQYRSDEINSVSLTCILNDVEGRVHLLKMDIEGAEYKILESTPYEDLRKVDAIVMEIHTTQPDHNPEGLVDYLTTMGFTCELDIRTQHVGYLFCYNNDSYVNKSLIISLN